MNEASVASSVQPAARPKREMTARQRNLLVRISLAAALFVLGMLLPLHARWEMILFLAAYAVIGWDILWKACRNIVRGRVFDENFLMSVATVGALALGDWREAVAVMLFYQTGEWFQRQAVANSRRSIASLMDIRPDYANLLAEDGTLVQMDPESIQVGQHIVVKPGERVPLDGTVLDGFSALDTAALTGESAPRDVAPGDEVISGCISLSGKLTILVQKPYGESTVAKVLDLVENSGARKAKTEQFITRFARYYTPAVCLAALLLALLPPVLLGQPFSEWVYRALTFLVISCPCALVISIPMSFFGGIGGASRLGVLVKGGNYLEALAATDTLVFDKTGTLTKGSFAVTRVVPAGGVETNAAEASGEAGSLLELAAYAEHYSNHPIARSVQGAYSGQIDTARLSGAQELAGYGVSVQIDGLTLLAGNRRLMETNGILAPPEPTGGTVIHIALQGSYKGWLLVEDEIKPDAAQALQELKKLGIRRTVMLTGDSDAVGWQVAARLGIDEVYAQLLPADKVEKVEMLMQTQAKDKKLAFVGDGINDAPVLARADIGIAMGGLGSDAAIEAADIVIMTDEPARIPQVIRISRKTLGIVRQNIVFALGVKAVVLLLGALGFASMWAAVFADVGVSVIAILNAMRALKAP